jgi:hypothetical protein
MTNAELSKVIAKVRHAGHDIGDDCTLVGDCRFRHPEDGDGADGAVRLSWIESRGESFYRFYVECGHCGARGPWSKDPSTAIDLWVGVEIRPNPAKLATLRRWLDSGLSWSEFDTE